MALCEASSKLFTCRHNHRVTSTSYRVDLLAAGPRRPPQLLPRLLVRVSSPSPLAPLARMVFDKMPARCFVLD
jgi:hypothetical protein